MRPELEKETKKKIGIMKRALQKKVQLKQDELAKTDKKSWDALKVRKPDKAVLREKMKDPQEVKLILFGRDGVVACPFESGSER